MESEAWEEQGWLRTHQHSQTLQMFKCTVCTDAKSSYRQLPPRFALYAIGPESCMDDAMIVKGDERGRGRLL